MSESDALDAPGGGKLLRRYFRRHGRGCRVVKDLGVEMIEEYVPNPSYLGS